MSCDSGIGIVIDVGRELVRRSFQQLGLALLPSVSPFSFPMLWKSCSAYFLGFLISQVKVNVHLFPFSSNRVYPSGIAIPFAQLAWFCQAVSVGCHWITVFPGLCVSSASSLCISVQNQPILAASQCSPRKTTGARLWRVKTLLTKFTVYIFYTLGGKSYRWNHFWVLLE